MDTARTMFVLGIISFLLMAIPGVGVAAEISIVGDDYYESPTVSIVGEIIPGDLDKFKKAAKEVILNGEYRYLHVYLNSPGGDAYEAMKIGRLLRFLLAKTHAIGFVYYDPKSKYGIKEALDLANHPESAGKFKRKKFVPRGEAIPDEYIGRCYSACVLIFYAGVERDASDNGYFRDNSNVIPVIGLHRPYYEKNYYSRFSPTEAEVEYKKLESAVADYLSEMGAPGDIIERMLKTASNDIEMVEHNDFKKFYERKEPFLEEWLLAKCGATTDGKELLSVEDYEYFRHLQKEKLNQAKKSVGYGSDRFGDEFDKYYPAGTDVERYTRALNSVVEHNQRVHNCKDRAIHNHQMQWAFDN